MSFFGVVSVWAKNRGTVLLPLMTSPKKSSGARIGERIETHEIPARVWFLDEQLPRKGNGKFIIKRELRDKLLAPDLVPLAEPFRDGRPRP